MAKPNFRWFGSGDNAVVFDVDDVSSVDIARDIVPYFKYVQHIITIGFYHRDSIKVSDYEIPGMSQSPTYQQVYNWVKNELVSNPAIEVKEK